MLSWKRRSPCAWLSMSWSWKGYRGRGGRAGAVEAMLVYRQESKGPTGSPCKNSLSMDRPTAFLSCSVLGCDTQRPTRYKLSRDATVDVDTGQIRRQVEASSGGLRKDLRSCRLDVRAGTLSPKGGCVRGGPAAADGRACLLCQGQSGHERCTNLQPATVRTVRLSPKIRESCLPQSPMVPNVASSQLAMPAACLAAVGVHSLSRPTCGFLVRLSLIRSRLHSTSGVNCLARAAERQRIQFDPRRQTFHLETWRSTCCCGILSFIDVVQLVATHGLHPLVLLHNITLSCPAMNHDKTSNSCPAHALICCKSISTPQRTAHDPLSRNPLSRLIK